MTFDRSLMYYKVNSKKGLKILSVLFIEAKPDEAKELSELRHRVWATTYRGIYPDKKIDKFDYAFHNEKDFMRITSDEYEVFFITEESEKIGYLILQKTNPLLYVQSLYLIEKFRGMGYGRKSFDFIRDYCRRSGYRKFYLGCHPQNIKALGFYGKMGGIITARDEGHEHNEENSVRIEFEV